MSATGLMRSCSWDDSGVSERLLTWIWLDWLGFALFENREGAAGALPQRQSSNPRQSNFLKGGDFARVGVFSLHSRGCAGVGFAAEESGAPSQPRAFSVRELGSAWISLDWLGLLGLNCLAERCSGKQWPLFATRCNFNFIVAAICDERLSVKHCCAKYSSSRARGDTASP